MTFGEWSKYREQRKKDGLCTWCGENPPRRPDGDLCGACLEDIKREQKEERAGWSRKSHLKKFYKISLETYSEMLKSQGGLCAICKKEQKGKPLFVDHDHATKKVRGLLCSNCNSVLGHAKDDIEILSSAIQYIKDTE